ncbi:MAG TPA: alkaline phosphatase family protein [Terriglobales bacterium]|nr:alkaline phosphatase family protein [Terriglobales bacterium]
MRRVWPTLVLFAYTGLLVGCAGSSGPETSSPPSVTLSAQPSVIIAGDSATLTWTSTNADSATLNGTNVATAGTTTVTPSQTANYTINVSGAGGTASAHTTVTVTHGPPKVAINASPSSITASQTSTLTVTASNAGTVVVTNNLDSTQYQLAATGGTQTVNPKQTVTYTATASGANNQKATAKVTVTVNPGSLNASVNHIIFLMQENRSFDHYFGMLNPYRHNQGYDVGDDGVTYNVDGIDDKLATITNVNDEGQVFSLFKLKSTCIDDDSAAWLPSFGSVNRFNFSPTRPINMDGFVHTAEGYAKHCADPASKCSGGEFTDLAGQRAMGYYDQEYLNYYYYMASQFAISDRWFSPVASESIPNRLATMTGGTTEGLVWDPGRNDHLPQLSIKTIFEALDKGGVSWKIYYSTTDDNCNAGDNSCGSGTPLGKMPSTSFRYFAYSTKYVHSKAQKACSPPLQSSGTAIGDPNDDFCIDSTHIAPISQFIADMNKGSLPSFAWVEPGYSHTDEHPGSGQSILRGQAAIANLFNIFMASPSWKDSIFFLSYDEGGGPYDHVPPVPGHTNDFTDPSMGITTDVSSIAVNPDAFFPCAPPNLPNPPGPATLHCDLHTVPFADPGVDPTDAAALQGFAAQLGFRMPNMIISPFVRRHYVSHVPMDHTAIIKLVETRFLGAQAHLTLRDAKQPDLMDFFDFTNVPWLTPPSNVPAPYDPSKATLTCTADDM